MRRPKRRRSWGWSLRCLVALASVGAAACGNLDDVTTVKDLRVLAIQAEPAGFLIDVDDPGAGSDADWQATLTALVVDPSGLNETVQVTTALGCPDYLDAITAATGTATRVCSATPIPLPDPTLQAALASTPLVPPSGQTVPPATDGGFTYLPTFQYGLTTTQLALLFASPPTGVPQVDAVLTNNRTFGLDAITSFTFTRGAQAAPAVKRVVYWPKLDPVLYPGQAPNQNPAISDVGFFRSRDSATGDPQDPLAPGEVPELSLAAGDDLYVLPAEATAETYTFYVKDREQGGAIVANTAQELLRYDFFATAGTFSPAERQSKPPALITAADGRVHLDSQYKPPDAQHLPTDGNVTIWIVVHDERAGVGWISRTIRVVP
ncbi:MAG TPA: hypothetical protein VHM31_17885 [Polyangia bacterium]|nr:hypothetical protein [Polyangia bacterium]